MVNVIAANRSGYKNMLNRLNAIPGQEFILIKRKEDLNLQRLQKIRPRYIFFPHWSFKVPEDVYSAFECIMFHMTDLPFGRGGSPLQNLIARGIYETQITAFRCIKELDAGPIYCKRPFSLYGTAEEIYMRAAHTIADMIKWIIKNRPEPVSQEGESCFFPRRKPEESNIKDLDCLQKLYDYIRMLDADEYPRAFLETEHFRMEFERASFKGEYIKADVIIRNKDTGSQE